MIGLIAIIVVGVLLALALWAYVWGYRLARRKGKGEAMSFGWGIGVVLLFSLPITWDAIPTWIAFEYFARKEAGITVFKTLEQWKAENPGMAETLEPYGFKDKRATVKNLGNNKFRHFLNDRFAYEAQSKDKLFLSVYASRYEVIDRKSDAVLVRYIEIGSGNAGGFATGGSGWWAFWLIHKGPDAGFSKFFQFVETVKNIGVVQ